MYKQYKDDKEMVVDGAIIRTTDMVCIPFDPANTDFQQFLKDIKEGVELLDADGNVVTDFVKELP